MESEYVLTSSTTRSSGQKALSGSSSRTPVGYTASRGYDSSLHPPGSPSPLNRSNGSAVDDLRADSDERAWLEKNNFDLKMKVYYLEENMKKMIESGAGNSTHSDYAEELRAENTNLRLQIEEKCLEMEQRNTLLIKAKTAIETLKSEIGKLRADKQDHADTETRMRSLIRENEEMEAKHRFRTEQLEVQVATLQQAVNMKEHGSHMVDEKLRVARQELEDSRRRIGSLEEEVRSLQRRLSESHAEMIEARSEVDGAKIHAAEQADAIADYKAMIAELQEMVTRLSDDRERLAETSESRMATSSSQYEAMLEAVKKAAEQDMQHAQQLHAKVVAELKETHSKEVDRLNAAKEEALRASRTQETTELFRMREDLQLRLQEKHEEVRSLKSAIELDRVRLDNAQRECEEAKAESRQRLATIDQLRDENASIEVLKVELRQSMQQCKELKVSLQQGVVVEKNQLLSRIEVLSDNLEASRDTIRELENSNYSLTTELTKIKDDMYESRKTLEAHSEVARENERLKASSSALREEVKELSGLLQNLQTETKNSREAQQRSAAELDRLRQVLNASEAHAHALDEALREEKSKHTAADAGLSEHRDLTTRLSHQLEEAKQQRIDTERRGRDGLDRLDSLRADIGKTCSMLSDAVDSWDKKLGDEDLQVGDADSRVQKKDISGEQRSKLVRQYVEGSVSLSNNDIASSLQQEQAELITSTIIRIERFRSKLDRLVNIRQNFNAKCENMLRAYEEKVSVSSDRMKVQNHRLDDIEKHFAKIKHTLDRDMHRRSTDLEEMRAFRESVVSGHSQQIQAITSLLEKERAQNGALNSELDKAMHDIREYRDQVKELRRMEDTVSTFKGRFDEVVESNRLLMLELDDRAKKYDRLKRDYADMVAERDDSISQARALSSSVRAKDDEMENLRRQVSYLRSREIDPELEKSFRDTQSIMRSYHSPEKDRPTAHSTKDAAIRRSDVGGWSELVNKVSSVYKSINGLVSSTAAAIDSFSEISSNGPLSRSQVRDTTELIFELLDSNAKLSMQVKRLFSEVKMEIESRSDDVASNSGSPHGRDRLDRNSNIGSRQENNRGEKKKIPSPKSNKMANSTVSGFGADAFYKSQAPAMQRNPSYDSEPEQFSQIHPESLPMPRPQMTTPAPAPIHHAVIPSRRGLQRETYDSEPEEMLKVHPEVHRPENVMFRNMEDHFESAGDTVARLSEYHAMPPEVAARHRGWSESSCPPVLADLTPRLAQVHPMEPVSHTAPTQYKTSERDRTGTYSARRESSPLTLSHFGGSTIETNVNKTTPQRSHYNFTPQSRGSMPRASADRLQRLGDDLTVLAKKLDSFDTSSRVKY